ncbi:unnamed protein product [Tilletia laevis]|uniref:CWF21 domain-containing protein n=2 Tax=Tilletia TaxID=13289 RepID=A0A9N8LSV7_9BASI|nr:unnamed protein product [Tilletia laevis]
MRWEDRTWTGGGLLLTRRASMDETGRKRNEVELLALVTAYKVTVILDEIALLIISWKIFPTTSIIHIAPNYESSATMYNGVGLQTTRGSGTSGYVVRNLSALRHRDERGKSGGEDCREDRGDPDRRKPADKGILDHDRKRKVEIRCMELQDELEEQGLPDDEVEAKVSQLRETLIDSLGNPGSSFGQASHADMKKLRPSDVHALKEAKAVEEEKWKSALGVRADYQEGSSFDPEYRKRLRAEAKQEKQAEWKRRDEERARRNADYERRKRAQEEDRRQFDDELRARRRQGQDRRSQSPPPSRREQGGRQVERSSSPGPSTSQRRSGKEKAERSPSPASPPSRRRRGSFDSSDGSRSPPPRRRRQASSELRSRSPSPRPQQREMSPAPAP